MSSPNCMLTLSTVPFLFYQHVHALLCTAGRSAAVLKASEAYSGRFINPSLLLLLGAWQRQLWRDTATNRPSKYGGLQSRGNAWSNFGPLHQTASIKGMRQRRGWAADDTLCSSICVLSVCSCVCGYVPARTSVCICSESEILCACETRSLLPWYLFLFAHIFSSEALLLPCSIRPQLSNKQTNNP